MLGGIAVASRYRVADDALVEEVTDMLTWDSQARMYWPAAHLELPARLAALQRGDVKAVLAFAQTYGELGIDEDGGPDTLAVIWQHAWNVRTCLELSQRIRQRGRQRDEALNQYFKNELANLGFGDNGARGWSQLLPVVYGRGMRKQGELVGSPESIALEIVEQILVPNLRRVTRQVLRDEKGRLVSDFRFVGLIDVIYWQLADAVTDGSLRRCKYCRTVFVAHNLKRDKYCPRPPDEIGESLCSLKARQKRHLRKPRLQRIATEAGTSRKTAPQVLGAAKKIARQSTERTSGR